MTYYSRTTTEPVQTPLVDAKFESNSTHHVVVVGWEHCNESIVLKVTNSPLKVEVSSYDGLNYHSLEFSLSLNYEIRTLAGAFYDCDDKGFRIHIPKANMELRNVETVTLQLKP